MDTFHSIIKGEKPVLVDFYADWCAPCRMMSPILQEIKHEMGDDIKILKINVDKNQTIAQKYRIQSIPALFIFRKGEIKWKNRGVTPAHQIKQVLMSLTK